jgi:hypothetical protein
VDSENSVLGATASLRGATASVFVAVVAEGDATAKVGDGATAESPKDADLGGTAGRGESLEELGDVWLLVFRDSQKDTV